MSDEKDDGVLEPQDDNPDPFSYPASDLFPDPTSHDFSDPTSDIFPEHTSDLFLEHTSGPVQQTRQEKILSPSHNSDDDYNTDIDIEGI